MSWDDQSTRSPACASAFRRKSRPEFDRGEPVEPAEGSAESVGRSSLFAMGYLSYNNGYSLLFGIIPYEFLHVTPGSDRVIFLH